MMHASTKRVLLCTCLPTILLMPAPAAAQDVSPAAAPASAGAATNIAPAGEIIVTAQRRSESVQNIPIAIQALSGATLSRSGVVQINQLMNVTPSFVYSSTGPDVNISMRGISGEIGGIAGEPPVALSLDGVPLLRMQYFYGGLFDIDRVEVLRGPQGTISGRNAISGAINILSRRPTDTFTGGITAAYGNYHSYTVGMWASGPVIPGKLDAHFAVERRSADGFIRSTITGQRFGGHDDDLARASLLFKPSDKVSLLLSGDYFSSGDRSPPYVSLGLYDSSHIIAVLDPPGFGSQSYYDPRTRTAAIGANPATESYTQKTYGITLQGTFELGGKTTLRTISGYRNLSGDQQFETVRGPVPIESGGDPYKQRQYTQEVSLTTSLGSAIDLLFGGVYLNENAASPSAVIFQRGLAGPTFDPPRGVTLTAYDAINLRSYAGFGQVQWRFARNFELTIGGRYTSDGKTYRGGVGLPAGAPPAPGTLVGPLPAKFNSFTPRVALDWKPNHDITIYASFSRGFTAGGFGAAGGLTPGFQSFKPETADNYEIGAKTQFFDRRVTANLTAFWADYKDLQYTFLFAGAQATTNAGQARVRGMEGELGLHPGHGVNLGVNATYLDPKYRVFCASNLSVPRTTVFGQPIPGIPGGICPNGSLGQSLAGNQLPRAAKLTVTANGSYSTAIGAGALTLTVDARYQSKMYFDAFQAAPTSQNRYTVLDLTAAFDVGKTGLTVAASVRNVLDVNYFIGKTAFQAGLAALDSRIPGTAANPLAGLVPASTILGIVGEPRSYGVSASYKF